MISRGANRTKWAVIHTKPGMNQAKNGRDSHLPMWESSENGRSGLNNEDERQSARLTETRGGDRNEETPATKNEGKEVLLLCAAGNKERC